MKVTKVKKEGNKVTFNVSGIDTGMINAFRRVIISKIPTMAIEEIVFFTNTSILNDENLGHRFGMIPLTTDIETYELSEECSCKGEGCGRCTCTLGLDIQGPSTIYSGDLISSDDRVKPVFPTMPLVKLQPKHHVKLEAKAKLGFGADHIKWQPGLCSFELLDNGSYDVFVESYGPLQVDSLVKKAFEVVDESILTLEKALK